MEISSVRFLFPQTQFTSDFLAHPVATIHNAHLIASPSEVCLYAKHPRLNKHCPVEMERCQDHRWCWGSGTAGLGALFPSLMTSGT